MMPDVAQPCIMSYAKSNIPVVGALVDYIETCFKYACKRCYSSAEKLHEKAYKSPLSPTFMASLCFVLGVMCNVKFEIMRFDDAPLSNDLHYILMSREEKIYIDDIDSSQVLWCLELSDFIVNIISCLLILSSEKAPLGLSQYLFMPWLGLALRGLFLRQVPTATALLYTVSVVSGAVNPLFLAAFSFLFLLEARLWLEIARLVRMRWERRTIMAEEQDPIVPQNNRLFTNDDTESIEVRNFVY